MRSTVRTSLVLTSLFALAVAGACSAGAPNNKFEGVGGAGGAGTGGFTPSSTSSSGIGGQFGTGGGDTCSGYHCSADLHQVLDCSETVVTTCPAGKGCDPSGNCVDPCASAQANGSTIGCDFYGVPPAAMFATQGSCYAALVANTWDTPITLSAEYNGKSLDMAGLARRPVGGGANLTYEPLVNGQLGPGELAILFLSQGPQVFGTWVGCPAGITPGINTDPAVSDTGRTHAFHLTTSAPIVAYDIYPYGGAKSYISSATLLVPTPSWGTNLIAADAYPSDPNLMGYHADAFIQVVAAEDGTQVTISPTAAILGGGGVSGSPKGTPITYTVDKGQVLQLQQPAELIGSPISSDKPISVWGGAGCFSIPFGQSACDSAHQELLPVTSLGHEYLAAKFRDRAPGHTESIPWTIMSAAPDDVNLTYDPAPPPGAPTVLHVGDAVVFETTQPFSVKSQDDKHPFYMAAHMSGWGQTPNSQGDPEYVNVVPPEQYLDAYLFLTDPTYANTSLVFTRKKAKADKQFKDVNLDCLGVVGNWQPIGNAGDYEFATVDLVADGAKQGNCDSGVHTAKSAVPFGLTVWGWDHAVSYGYPAGMSVKPINSVVVPPVPK